MRHALMVSALVSSFASVGDLAMVMRWNVRWGIPDKAFYLVGDTILEPIVGMMAFMPGTILISKESISQSPRSANGLPIRRY